MYTTYMKWTGCLQEEEKRQQECKQGRSIREGVCLLIRLEPAADLDSRPGLVLLPRDSVRSCTPMASFILDRNANLRLQHCNKE